MEAYGIRAKDREKPPGLPRTTMQPDLPLANAPVHPHGPRSAARWRRANGAPLLLTAGATLVALAMLLPLAYLLLRAAEVGLAGAIASLSSPRTLQVVANSIVLAVLVTGISLAVSLPLAWLTARTDLPGRHIWSPLLALPLVIPTYVGAYALVSMMGPRGIVQGWLEPLGVQRLPSIYGLPGAVWALTILSYPYIYLSIRAGFFNLDPAQEEARAQPRLWPLADLLARRRCQISALLSSPVHSCSPSTCSATLAPSRSCASTALPA